MQITPEHKTQIEEIISGMECPGDFHCYKTGFEDLCNAWIFQGGELVECVDKRGFLCKFSLSFGNSYFCKCPLRKYIAKTFNK